MPIEPRSSVVVIYTGDYLDRIRHLEQRAEAAKEAAEEDGPRRLMELPEYVRLAEEHDALVKEADEKALRIRLRALGRREWKTLIAEHEPRKDNEQDQEWGFNWDTLPDVLVPRSIVEPEGFTEDDLDSLSAVDFNRIFGAAIALNALPGGDPKASLVSHLTQASSETSD